MHKVIDYISESGTEVLEEGDKDGVDILVSLTYIGKNREKDNGIKLTRTFETARKIPKKAISLQRLSLRIIILFKTLKTRDFRSMKAWLLLFWD
ncbi:hypothetical protein PKHYL_35500 [Psychrobacter sp. KH172YL61]|uniref:hypothetical protein n=1 Tax=Psychrobacter sp. KH172YL61 TaxID=2517899 RepID=UPI0010B5A34D|nr:hypothetical protein [Psychrobacter sp. KH172YL61]BBI69359.1 hypothetical protein PKHYL_35500 [Psychrobacter sp. KH172YL61]